MGCSADPTRDDDKNFPPCPLLSLKKVLLEAILIVGSYVALSMVLDNGGSLSSEGILTFLTVFIPISFVLKAASVDYDDQLARVAMFQLGVKLFNVLAGV